MDLSASVANKRLTAWLSPLDATLTKNRGYHPSSQKFSPCECFLYVSTFRPSALRLLPYLLISLPPCLLSSPARAVNHLPVFWTSRQYRVAEGSRILKVSQSQGEAMNEVTVWIQSNWYETGNLLSQFVFLAAGIWFARKILKTIRASQEQFGALLNMSVTGATTERHSSNAAGERPFAGDSPYWLTPGEVPPAGLPRLSESGPSERAVARHGLVVWLQTPMSSGGVAPWRRAVRWLQAPAGS